MSESILDRKIPSRNTKYLPKKIRQRIPAIGSQDSVPLDERIVHVKFFHPISGWRWYITEASAIVKNDNGTYHTSLKDAGDGSTTVDVELYGYVEGFCGEWGPVMLSELLDLKFGFGLVVERDKYFTPVLAGDIPKAV